MTLDTDYKRLLNDIFLASIEAPDGLNALRFRADNEQSLTEIDELEHFGFIERRDDRYFVRPLSLAQLAKENPEAERMVRICGCVFDLLRNAYKEHPGQRITIPDLARSAGLPEDQIRESLRYLIQTPIWGSYTNDLTTEDAFVSPSESILRFKSFEELLQHLQQWAANNTKYYFKQTDISDKRPRFLVEQGTAFLKREQALTKPAWYPQLDSKVRDLMDEIYYGLSKEMRALPSMGLRAVIDVVCNHLVGNSGGFCKKLGLLVEKGYITPNNKRILDNALEVGHASTHRGYFPEAQDLKTVLDIVEHLLQEVYVLGEAAKRLKTVVPKRSSYNSGK